MQSEASSPDACDIDPKWDRAYEDDRQGRATRKTIVWGRGSVLSNVDKKPNNSGHANTFFLRFYYYFILYL